MIKAQLFDTLLDPIFVINNEMKVIYCNETAAVIADSTVRKIMRQQSPLSDLFQGFQLDQPLTAITEQTPYRESTFTTANGQECRVQWTVQPFADNEWMVFFKDVTLEERLQKKYRGELDQKEHYIESLKKAQAELEHYSKNLEKMVEERTEEIRSMNKTMQALLDSLHQGFFIFNAEGNILPIYSKACETLYLRAPTGIPVWNYLNLTEKQVPGFKKWMVTVFDELLPFPDLAPLGPEYLPTTDGRTVKLEYYPIRREDSTIEAVVVMATDISALVEAQKEAAREKNHAQFILKLIQSKNEVLRFVKDGSHLLHDIQVFTHKPWNEVDHETFYRLLHTLKGGAASFSGDKIAESCHHAESILSELIHNPSDELHKRLETEVDHIVHSFEDYSADCKRILGPLAFSTERYLQIPESDLMRIIRDLRSNPAAGVTVADHFTNRYMLEPLSSFFMGYNDSLSRLAVRLEKEVSPVRIINGEILVWGYYYQPIFATFVHLFRNALDHGIETPMEREASGKPAAGSLSIEFELSVGEKDKHLIIKVSDDGRGINPEKIKEKLLSKGITLPSWDEKSLFDTLFMDDMSLAKEVTDISGRGVGLSAVKALVEEHHGKIEIHSKMGEGTTFEIHLPYVHEPPKITHLPPVPKAS